MSKKLMLRHNSGTEFQIQSIASTIDKSVTIRQFVTVVNSTT